MRMCHYFVAQIENPDQVKVKICLTVLQLVWRRSLDFSIACSTRQDFQRSFLIEEKAPFSPIYTLIHGILSLYSSDHANWAIRRLLLIIWLPRFFLDSFVHNVTKPLEKISLIESEMRVRVETLKTWLRLFLIFFQALLFQKKTNS